ncbi:hypothetical protein [Algoriphagus mannitolivorans]|uniref:hypothetical protein n=1 Tax=Algoriphagus mannitolivorans TaxID=226504 RepID=UPI0003FAFCDD|nr:hypothetical protein [Algoriphagus mannitolivorans]
MKHVKELRKISKVFQQYGIQLTGKRKFASFEGDLKMDKIFVNGLIYELEFELRKELDDEKVSGIQAPAQVIELLIS